MTGSAEVKVEIDFLIFVPYVVLNKTIQGPTISM